VLVVDDDPDIREMLTTILGGEGYVVEAMDGGHNGERPVVARVRTFAPDVILLDVMMRPRDGWAVLAELREHCPRVPVIMLSAWLPAQDRVPLRDMARMLGASDWCSKPFQWDELKALIDNPPPRLPAAAVNPSGAPPGMTQQGEASPC
jgi:DNA-binding response OmpR family regulator